MPFFLYRYFACFLVNNSRVIYSSLLTFIWSLYWCLSSWCFWMCFSLYYVLCLRWISLPSFSFPSIMLLVYFCILIVIGVLFTGENNSVFSHLVISLWVLLDTILCDKVCQWLAAGRWVSLGTPVSSTNKTDHHDIIEILLKVALNTITLTPFEYCKYLLFVTFWYGTKHLSVSFNT